LCSICEWHVLALSFCQNFDETNNGNNTNNNNNNNNNKGQKIVPVIIGALGAIKKGLAQNRQLLPGHRSVIEL
jgi:hypothetical protein